jgi:oligosaccharide repeat unit polymerase
MLTLLFLAESVLSIGWLLLRQPKSRRTILDPGVLLVSLFSLCYLAPGLAIMGGAELFGDSLILDYAESVSLYGCVFVPAFTLFYEFVMRLPIAPRVDNRKYKWSPGIYLFFLLAIFALIKSILLYFGVGSSDEYVDQYAQRAAMPLGVSQFINVVGSFQFILLCLLVSRGLRMGAKQSAILVLGLVALVYFADMLITKSRANFVTLAIMVACGHSFYRKPIGIAKEAIVGVGFILLMGLFAVLRAGGTAGSASLLPSEFTAIYGNAIHMVRIEGTAEFTPPPGSSYLQSLIAFIPQQLNPGKWDVASWYVGEYFPSYKDIGGGLAFGLIPEAIINFGLASMVLQAAFVALTLGLSKKLAQKQSIYLFMYFYSIGSIYQLVRFNSLAIVGGLVMGLLVPYFIISSVSMRRATYRPAIESP